MLQHAETNDSTRWKTGDVASAQFNDGSGFPDPDGASLVTVLGDDQFDRRRGGSRIRFRRRRLRPTRRPRAGYDFDGFYAPVNNKDASGHNYILNAVKAGSAIPVKFSLGGDHGLDVFEAGYPRSQVIECNSRREVDGIEETVTAGASSLSYAAGTDTYNYVWKTDKSWEDTCRQLVVKFDDGTTARANFKFH